MPVTVYRTTSSETVYYQGELTYLSLEATSGSSGVSTFAATITITPLEGEEFDLSSGVTVYYSIDTSGGRGGDRRDRPGPPRAPCAPMTTATTCWSRRTAARTTPSTRRRWAAASPTTPRATTPCPVEAGDYNEQYVQILSGVEEDVTVFLRYQNAAPSGGDTTSEGDGEEEGGMPGFGGGEMPDFGSMGGAHARLRRRQRRRHARGMPSGMGMG